MRIININGPINSGKSTTSKLLHPLLLSSIFIEVDDLMTDEEESSLGLSREEGWAERLKRLDNIIIQEKKLQRYENIVFAYPMTDNLHRQWKLWEDDNTKLICITLSPKIEICLQNRGTRIISEDEKIRIKEMYLAGYNTSQFADLIIDNGKQTPQETVKTILDYLEKEPIK